MPNRRPPQRRLVPLRMIGDRRLSQLEAHSMLRVIRFVQAGDWLAGFHPREIEALSEVRAKLLRAVAEARRLSIPKGMTERPDTLPTIFDDSPVPTASSLKPQNWSPDYKPWSETRRAKKARHKRTRYVEKQNRQRAAERKGRIKKPETPPLSEY